MEVKAVFLGWKDGDGNLSDKPLSHWDDLAVGEVYTFTQHDQTSRYPFQLKGGSGVCRGDEVIVVSEGPINLDDYL